MTLSPRYLRSVPSELDQAALFARRASPKASWLGFAAALVCLLGSVAGTPLVQGQRPAESAPARVPRVGWLGLTEIGPRLVAALGEGLTALGYVDGETVVIEARFADNPEQFPELAAQLIALPVDVLVSSDAGALVAARQATSTVPIVMAGGGNPVTSGLVPSLDQPGNVTGVSGPSSTVAQMRLLKGIFPETRQVVVIAQANQPTLPTVWADMQPEALELGLELRRIDMANVDDLAAELQAAVNEGAQALLIVRSPLLGANSARMVELANQTGLPAIYPGALFAAQGGLLAYGVNAVARYHQAALFVDRILNGAEPAEIPFEQGTEFDLVINLRTAEAQGLTIPESIVVQATRVIR